MKNTLLLFVSALFMASCSVDNEGLGLDEKATENVASVQRKAGTGITTGKGGPSEMCITTLSAHYEMDMSGGLNNPKVNFVINSPLGVTSSRSFYAAVEVQQVPDCEDYNYGTGPITSFGGIVLYYNISTNAPRVVVQQGQFPVCFRWRMVLTEANTSCVTYTPWYDAPVL